MLAGKSGDPLYLGLRRPRLRGTEYFDLVDRFVQAVRRHFPAVLLQWEDFSKDNAYTLLEKYLGGLLSFNDDVQGTGAAVLAGIACAVRATGGHLRDQVYVLYGSGAAGSGVAMQIRTGLVAEGLTPATAAARIYVFESRGLLVEGRAVVATGSPFPDVRLGGRTFTVGQGNNAFIFPGVGLGAIAVRARAVSDEMFTAAAVRLAELVPEDRIARNCVYPAIGALREISREIALVVPGPRSRRDSPVMKPRTAACTSTPHSSRFARLASGPF